MSSTPKQEEQKQTTKKVEQPASNEQYSRSFCSRSIACEIEEDEPILAMPIDGGATRSSKNPFNDDDDDGAYMGRIRPIGNDGRPTRRR